MALIPKALFPNVPKLPGVPQLNRSTLFPAGPPPVVGAAVALGRLWQALFAQPVWGIFRAEAPTTPSEDGVETVTVVAERKPVVKPDNILEFGYRNEFSVSDYPVQDGAFASYDKVNNPFEIVLRLSKGGSERERKAFLDSIYEIAGDLLLYDIVTPEKTYLNVNVLRFEVLRRGPRGAAMLSEVDLYFREIRVVTAIYSTTQVVIADPQNPSAKSPANTGAVQPQPTELTTEAAEIEGPQ